MHNKLIHVSRNVMNEVTKKREEANLSFEDTHWNDISF